MYNWIETTFNVSGGVTQVIAVLLALAAVLLLFGLFIFILRRLMSSETQQNRSRQPRIAVMDSAAVDTKRRLILIRRDNIEHLILVGGPSDVVVEQNIIRHAPLGSARPGTIAQAAVPGQIKSPVAPGPDLPPRPDEWAAQTETAPPPPAVQARPPSPAPRPATAASPSTSAPARAPAPSAPAATPAAPAAPRQPVMEKARVNPFAAKPPQADVKPATAPLDVRPDPKPEPAGSTGRAADLLRAATQNGFNRTVSKPQSPAVPPVADRAADMGAGAEQVRQAPEVKAEPAPAREEAPPAASETASPFKSLTRPFSPRERPSYGGYSITPPASGPAARAKTALLKPVEAEQPAHKIEPVLPAAPAAAATPPQAEQKAETEGPEPDVADDSREDTGAVQTEPETAGVSAPEEDRVSEETDSTPAATADQDETATASAEDPQTAGPSGDEPQEDRAAKTVTQRDIELDLGDLIVDDGPAEAEPGPDDAVDIRPARQDEDQGAGDTPERGSAPEVKLTDTEVKPVAKPTAGLGNRNPIEEEMAKILDELGGQSRE